ncbi:hypothetical protein EON67_02760 [archaeon]|nr:MAG: hypothetical protein EON67_02760 [archaeon]
MECSAGGAEFTLAIHGRSSKVTLSTMEARLPLEAFEVRPACRRCARKLAGSRRTGCALHILAHVHTCVRRLQSVMEAAMRGCEQMLEIMTQLMKEHTAKAFRSRGAITAS